MKRPTMFIDDTCRDSERELLAGLCRKNHHKGIHQWLFRHLLACAWEDELADADPTNPAMSHEIGIFIGTSAESFAICFIPTIAA